jgi:hypothetical protein
VTLGASPEPSLEPTYHVGRLEPNRPQGRRGETGLVALVASGHSLFVRSDCPLGEARHAELVGGGSRLLEEPAALG